MLMKIAYSNNCNNTVQDTILYGIWNGDELWGGKIYRDSNE